MDYNLGKIMLTPKGEYDNSATYEILDVVTHNGSSYVAKRETTGNVPPVEGATNTYWQLLAHAGDTSGKADKVSGATNGDFAGLDGNGNLIDSGYSPSDFITDVQVNGSSVTNNGVADILTETAYNASTNKIATVSDLPVVPVISTDIEADGTSDTKTASPKAVKTFVENKGYANKVSGATLGNFAALDSTGNLTDSGYSPSDYMSANESVVKYISQTLTTAQMEQARTNIGAGTSNFNGAYRTLSQKPTINGSEVDYDDRYDDSAIYELPIVTYRENVDFLQLTEQTGCIAQNGWDDRYGKYYLIPIKDDIVGIVFDTPNRDGEFAYLTSSQLIDGTDAPPSPKNAKEFVSTSVPHDTEDYIYILSEDTDRNNVLPKNLYLLRLRDRDKIDMPSGGSTGQVLKKTANGTEWANESGAVTDVTVGGTSVVSSGTAAIPAIPDITNCIQTSNTAGLVKNDGTIDTTSYGTYSKPSGGIPAADLASGVIPTVPTISTDIATDKASTTKTASPSAVWNEVHPAVGSSQPAGGMLPNVMYNLGTLSGDTTFAMATASDNTIVNHWYWTFDTPSTAPTITWPAAITSWFGGAAPIINASKHYEISVLNGIAVCMEV